MSFRSGAVATKMAEGSESRLRLLPHNNVKRKSGNKSLTPCPRAEYGQKHFGMKKWTEFFVLGYKPANSSKRMFDKIVRIISKHSPSKQYLKTKKFV
jgi:hypothetical protein